MDLQNRKKVFQVIKEDPGINKTELTKRTGLSWGTVGHHLRMLERDEAVALVRVGRTVHASPIEFAKRFHGMDALACPETRHTLAVLFAVSMGRGATELGRAMGLTRKQVRRHLQELIDGGLVRTDGAYHPRYCATETGKRVAQRLAIVDFSFKDAVDEATPTERDDEQGHDAEAPAEDAASAAPAGSAASDDIADADTPASEPVNQAPPVSSPLASSS